MNYLAIGKALSVSFIVVGLTALLPLMVAISFDETPQIFAFGFSVVFCVILGAGGWILTAFAKTERKNGSSELLAFTFLWWFLTPFACALPFVLGVINPSVYLAVQEAASCLTTTGYSVVEVGRGAWPESLLIWRGVLHFVGGFASILTLAGVLSHFDMSDRSGLLAPLIVKKSNDLFQGLLETSVTIGKLYSYYALVVFILLSLTGAGMQEAFIDMTSIVSTGNAGVDGVGSARSGLNVFVCALGLLISTAGFWFIYLFAIFKPQMVIKHLDFWAFGSVFIVLVVMATSSGLSLVQSSLWATSALSTSNMFQGAPSLGGADLPLALIIVPAIIGGAAYSTTGGIKLSRILLIIGRFRGEIHRSLLRNSTEGVLYNGQASTIKQMLNVWVYLIAFTVAIALMQFLLSLFGVGWSDSIRLAVGAFCNSGGLIEQAQSSTNLTGISGGTVLVAMILGRVEIFPILVIFTKNFWTR